ncbi:MAG: type II toxin-antitoxin system RelE/ParE family toxin [Desulfobacteraceae bacterium]|nr:type II toxin-antitoxin system RelE/ParE family toxin [Desulfobacteraceae bacterium]
MKILQSASFERKVKKFSEQEKAELDDHIRTIIQNPLVGIEKKGDLKDVFVYKFKLHKQLCLLSYRLVRDDIELIMIGHHENYYRDLKQYLKKRKD